MTKPKAFWQYVNSKVKTRPSITELLHSNGTAASSDAEMATIFLVFLPLKIPPRSQ